MIYKHNIQCKNTYDFFISYSRDIYEDVVFPLVQELDNYGFNIWIDKTEVPLGIDIYQNIFEVMENCEEWYGAIIIIDKSYFNKPWCQLEIDFLIDKSISLLPILHKQIKEDIPSKYTQLINLNYSRVENEQDLNISINKILDTFISKFQPINNNFNIKSSLLKVFIHDYNKTNKNTPLKILSAYNVTACLKNLLITSNIEILREVAILFKIVEIKMHDLVLKNNIDRHDILIVCRVTDNILHNFNLNA